MVILLLLLSAIGGGVEAAGIDELQQKIAARNTDIQKLEAEIAAYQTQLDAASREKISLQGTISTLDISLQKLTANIRITENRIVAADLRITQLAAEIENKSERIGESSAAVLKVLRNLNDIDRRSPMALVLAGEDFGAMWNQVEELEQFQTTLRGHVAELTVLKTDLESRKAESEVKKRQLVELKGQLANQKKVLDINRREKNTLLADTKNKESNFQKLIAFKAAERKQFEQELLDYQSQLKIAIDPRSLPQTGSGVLLWPLDSVYVTQYFGNTDFATKNPQIYNGGGHNGIDLRASPGTPVKAARLGTVVDAGDTDLTCKNASYGRWVLIRHDNGLSTLYAHLSLTTVSKGQSVSTGQTIGYSGSTGYATGPHLHFIVYATQGVEVATLPSKALACKGKIYTLPLADIKAYLNPLSYL